MLEMKLSGRAVLIRALLHLQLKTKLMTKNKQCETARQELQEKSCRELQDY